MLQLMMTGITFKGLMLFVLISHASSQAITQSATGSVASLSTEASCGLGNTACPNESPGSNELLVPTDPSVPLPEDSTVFTPVSGQKVTTVTPKPSSTLTSASISTKAATTTATLPVISQKVPKQEGDETVGYSHSRTCGCDLTARDCDINCCCDPECSYFQRGAFSKCKVDGYPPYDNRYCYSSKLIFLNNSEHLLQQSQNGAFCIVRTNLAGSVLYTPQTIFPSHQEFLNHWERSNSPAWPEPFEPKLLVVDKPRLYSAGASIWVLSSNHMQPLRLPSCGLTSACSKLKAVQYLVPWSTQCVRKTPQTESECKEVTSFLFSQIKNIVRSPLLINQTKLLSGEIDSCTSEVCAPVAYFVCQGASFAISVHNCKSVQMKQIFMGSQKGVCHSVVKRMRLSLYHNGSVGIDQVRAYLWLVNLTLDTSPRNLLHQSIAVDFNWVVLNETVPDDTNEKSTNVAKSGMSRTNGLPLARSGNPGYIVGKPVISGFRVKQKLTTNSSKENVKEEKLTKHDMINLSHDPMNWVTLPLSDSYGMCNWSEGQRHIVTFGEDLHMSCSVLISPKNISSLSSCNALKSKMLHLLLGYVQKIHQNISAQSDWGRVVAAFGNANVSVLQDWVPFLIDYQPSFPLWSEATVSSKTSMLEELASPSTDPPSQTCESVPLGIQIQFMHGFVGTSLSPQSKILGAFMRFYPVQDIGLSCETETCFQGKETMHLRVVSTVRFLDISSPAVTRFAEPPAIHIRLPPDFFYPFMATEGSSSISVYKKPWLVILTTPICIILMVFMPHVFV